jgi:hypothetical protein
VRSRAEELRGGHRVSARLHPDAKHSAVLVDRAPQKVDHAVDPEEDFIEMPFVAGRGPAPAQPVGVDLPTFAHHCRMDSSLITTPRCSINSSPSRKLSGTGDTATRRGR